ncbi:DUF4760 domain-containing protein [Bergeriella denitrificans]|uniref:Phage associated protein n=1 Tax=Bergeriella denitrificans TaxID=494 RepID=A0A378UHB3_BERDE|nr:DUF4760 domain-containing protein [Bergeriella denitrificans]STZ76695.1 phage associated protein [Bergeriella denitrificans]
MTETNSIYHYITPILTVIGVFVAAYGIFRNTENAKKRATIDLIIMQRNDEALQKAIKRVNEMSKTEGCIFSTYIAETEETYEDRESILKVLNQREFVAAGVLRGAFHEPLFKEFEYSILLRDWNNLNGFIQDIRRIRNAPTAFQEFETLAKKWKKKPLKVKH